LKVGNNAFYYFPPAVSGAGTEYRTLQPGNGVDVYMQGDFSAYSMYPYSDAVIHFNGYEGTINYGGITAYASGNVVLDAGSTVNLPNGSLRGFYANNGGIESYITASGEAAAFFPAGNDNDAYVDTPFNLVTLSGSDMSISWWMRPNKDKVGSTGGGGAANNMNVFSGYVSGVPDSYFRWDSWIADSVYSGWGGVDYTFQLLSHQNNAYVRSTTLFNTGLWNHCTLTYEDGGYGASGTMKLYVNGILEDTSAGDFWSIASNKVFQPGYDTGASNVDYMGGMADVRIYPSALTSGNTVTLAAINPATNVSGAIYADPDNDLGAICWWKMGVSGSISDNTVDTVNYGTSGAAFDGTPEGSLKTGFVTITGAAGFGAINNPYQDMTLTNTYISGMADIVVGETSQGANPDSTLITKGTVVLD